MLGLSALGLRWQVDGVWRLVFEAEPSCCFFPHLGGLGSRVQGFRV